MIPGHHHHVDPGAATPPHGIGNVGANRVDEPDQTENFEGRDLGALRRYRSLYVTMGHGKHPVAPGGEAVELLLYAIQVERGLAFPLPCHGPAERENRLDSPLDRHPDCILLPVPDGGIPLL